jgi:DNA-binding XRE family transcriptional regulator
MERKSKKRRKEFGLSQAELGDLIGTTQQTIALIETGKNIHSRYLRPIEQVLKFSLDDDNTSECADLSSAVERAFEFCIQTGWFKTEPTLTPKMFADIVFKEMKNS